MTSMSDQQTAEAAYQYSVRIERTVKGARWTVHCYGKDLETSMNEAVKAYNEVGQKLAELLRASRSGPCWELNTGQL
jgi:hypothetical protein